MKRPAAEQLGKPAPGPGKVAAFFCIEDAGHINPLVALAEILVTRGHTVHFFAPVTCREKVEGSGAVWCHYGWEDWTLYSQAEKVVQEQFKQEPDWELRSMPYAVLPVTIGVVPWLLARMGQLRPDFIVHDSAVPWGMVVGRLLRIPTICSMTALPPSIAEREQTANRWKQRKNVDTAAEVLRQAYGIEHNVSHNYTNYQPFTVVWSTRSWHKGHTEFPPEQFRYWGPLVSARKGLTLPDLPKDGRPLVYVSLGTIVTGDSFRKFGTMVHDFYRKVLLAAAQMPEVRFLLATGKHESLVVTNGTLLETKIPENVTALLRVDQLAALEVAAVFVTHCGQNSCSEAILNGVPVVAMPIFADQPRNAERFEELGCGIYLSYHRDPATGKSDVDPTLDRVTTDQVVSAVRKVLNEPSYREAMQRLRKAEEDERGPSIEAKLEELLQYVERESAHRLLP